MKTKWMSLALVILSSNIWAQTGELFNAEVTEKTSVTHPAKAMKAVEGQWLAFSIPVQSGTHSPCCWKGKWHGKRSSQWNDKNTAVCSLESKHQSYGTRSDSELTENVIVFGQVSGGKVHDLRVVGESCPIDGDGAQVTWIGSVDETAGLDWLETVARSDKDDTAGGSALYALALHRSREADQRLYSLAKETGSDLSEQAIFWLGENRGEQGFKKLKQLLADKLRAGREQHTRGC